MSVAGVAHPVERHLAKVEVASSSLVTRSIKKKDHTKVWSFFFMELVGDRLEPSKSNSPVDCWASPARRRCILTRCPADTEASSLVTRSSSTQLQSLKKKGHTSVWPFCVYFPPSACSFNGPNTFPRTRELK